MKTLEFTPEEMNKVVYEIQKAERNHEEAKLLLEQLEDKSKAMFAAISNAIVKSEGSAKNAADAETLNHEKWKNFLFKEYYPERSRLLEFKLVFNHLLRVLKAIEEGMNYNKMLLAKNVHTIGGK